MVFSRVFSGSLSREASATAGVGSEGEFSVLWRSWE